MSKIDKKAVEIMNIVYREIMGIPEHDKRHKCWGCSERLNAGEGRIFQYATYIESGIIKRTRGLLYHKHRKDCKNKLSWTNAHKEHLKIRRMK